MAIEFRCGDCQKLLRVSDENAGKQARCPECGHISQIPAAEVEQSPAPQSSPSQPSSAADMTPQYESADSWAAAQSSVESAAENPYAPPLSVNPETQPRQLARVHLPLASRWKRLGGSILDGLIYLLAMAPGFIAIMMLDGAPDEFILLAMIMLFGGLGAVAIYNWYLITRSGQSIAKRMLGMRIVSTGGELPGFLMGVLVRQWIPAIINQFCSVFSLIDALFIFGEERRCIHDYMANTIVVDTTLESPNVSSSHSEPTAVASSWSCQKCGAVVAGTWGKCSSCGELRR